MTLELANRAICTPDGIARDVFVPVGKFTFPADFVVVNYESDPRIPLILGRPFLRTTRALINVHGEEMILRDGDERLTLNMKHDTASYSNHPYRESVNLISVFNLEDCLKDLVSHKQSGNPAFSLHKEIASPEVIPDTTYSADSLLEEFADELALISYPPDYDDYRACDIESDIREIEFLLFQEMFIKEQPLDYSFPLRFDVYPDDFLEIESDATFDDDSFDSEGEKIKKAEHLIDPLDLPCDILSEYDSWLFGDFDPPFSELLVFKEVPISMRLLPFSSKNEEKVFKPRIYTFKKFHCCFLSELSHLAARLGCAETKVATWDDLAFKLITLGWNVKH
nr:reverse transcriptase domain-containing protein [Tanacetum cinerariifolium]